MIPAKLPRQKDIEAHVREIYSIRLKADRMERKDQYKEQFKLLLDLSVDHGFYDMLTFEAVLYYLKPATIKRLYDGDDKGKKSFLNALCLYFLEIDEDRPEDFDIRTFGALLDQAHKKGHKAAKGFKAHVLYYYYLAEDNVEKRKEMEQSLIEAAIHGCVGSYIITSDVLYQRKEYFASHYYCKLGTMYGYVDECHLLCQYPDLVDDKGIYVGCVPMHLWRPEPYIHAMCSIEALENVMTWLLINHRKKYFTSANKYLVYYVCKFLV